MANLTLKSLSKPDEIRSLPKTKIEVVNLGDTTIMRATFEPGWKWSECLKPQASTESCEVPHINYIISGRLKIAMDDGNTVELSPGDAANIPPGHDAWVIGNEPCIVLDFIGGKIYGKK